MLLLVCIVRVMNLASKAQFKAPASYLSLHHPTDNGLEAEALQCRLAGPPVAQPDHRAPDLKSEAPICTPSFGRDSRLLALQREAHQRGKQRRHHRLDSKMKYWIARGSLLQAVAKGGLAASRPCSAIYLDFLGSTSCRPVPQSGARCPSSLGDELPVLDTTLPQRHMADSTSPTQPHPLPFETLFPSSRSRTLPSLCRSLSQAGPNRYHLSLLSLFSAGQSTIIAFATFTTVQRRALGAL